MKKPWESKTVLLNALVTTTGLLGSFGVVPSISCWIEGHNSLILSGLGLLGVALRWITHDKIAIE